MSRAKGDCFNLIKLYMEVIGAFAGIGRDTLSIRNIKCPFLCSGDGLRIENEQQNIYDFCGRSSGAGWGRGEGEGEKIYHGGLYKSY